jgi:hypothetical protein
MKAFKVVGRGLVWAVIACVAALVSAAQLAIGLPRQILDEGVKGGYAYSFQITEAFVNQYEANFYVLAQQMAARFEAFVDVVSGIVGQSRSAERVGKTDAYDIQSRHADTKYVETPHSRRWIDLQDKGWADLVDELDEIRMLANPTSVYPKMAMAALNRAKDDVIYAAARGSARTNTGTTALPAGQKIAEGGTGLTLAKLLSTKELLDAAEIEDDAEYDRIGQTPASRGDAVNNTVEAAARARLLCEAAHQPVRHDRDQVGRLQHGEGARAGHDRHVPRLPVRPVGTSREDGHDALCPRLVEEGDSPRRRQGHRHLDRQAPDEEHERAGVRAHVDRRGAGRRRGRSRDRLLRVIPA